MSGSIYGTIFRVSTWGESHGKALGAVVDGCPAGMELNEDIIQSYLNRRKPGQNKYTTKRSETDQVEILSGIFDQRTTGTPISMVIRNQDQRSKDYSDLASCYRPGHADYTYNQKYGFRDYRGGGRSSGRETIGRVAAGSIALQFLKSLGIKVFAYTVSIGSIQIEASRFDQKEILNNPFAMPDKEAAVKASDYLQQAMEENNSVGGIIECVVQNLPSGIGEPVFDKLDAQLAKGITSIGAVKGFEIGAGMKAASMSGSEMNDPFVLNSTGSIVKASNFSGGTLGGISDGDAITIRAAIKPTPSISRPQRTVNQEGKEIEVAIKGRHDPIIVPRAVVVVEAMTALTVADMILLNMSSRMDKILEFYRDCDRIR